MRKAQRFWLVWNSSNLVSSARYRHFSKASAMAEAERLAKANPQHDFVVLKAVGCVCAAPPEVVHLSYETVKNDDDVPF